MALSHIHHGFRDVRRRQAKGELIEGVEVLGREEAGVAEYVGGGGGRAMRRQVSVGPNLEGSEELGPLAIRHAEEGI
jgi:hypothetical protein